MEIISSLNPNKLEIFLKKPASQFSKDDIIRFIENNNIKMLNFRYIAEDGRLKTLNFVINSREHLDSVLTTGERVDGSSIFSYIEASSSDLYVVPRFKTAFINPFAQTPTLDILCSFYTNDGTPLESAPEYILKKAHSEFKKKTGFTFKAMGELEFYIISPKQEHNLFPAVDQKGYHTSAPFTKWEDFRLDAMELIAQSGGKIKYGHSEVGNFNTETEYFEQQEIEFIPVNVEDAVDQLVVAKWIVRMLAQEYDITVSFAPKITVGKAGSGLHIHMMLEKEGHNMMVENNKLSDTAKKVIAGVLDLSSALTAFGNTIPTSYLRLVPHQEAPTNICWGDRNRSVLVRVPLGWIGVSSMINNANPNDDSEFKQFESKQTIELRSGDGSADLYSYLAGIVVAAQHGLEMKDALQKADELYMSVNIFDDENKDKLSKLEHLPSSCFESAEYLEKKREFFEKNNIFPTNLINRYIELLKSYDDKNLSERLYGKDHEIKILVNKFLHCK